MDIYENKVVDGVSQCKMKATAGSFLAQVFQGKYSLGGHAILLPYNKKRTAPPITRALDLPNLTDGTLAEYLSGDRFNGKE